MSTKEKRNISWNLAKNHSGFLTGLSVPDDAKKFKKFINNHKMVKKAKKDWKKKGKKGTPSTNYIGGIILQRRIVNMIENFKQKVKRGSRRDLMLAQRLKTFRKPEFVDNFLETIIPRYKFKGETTDYGPYLNAVFHIIPPPRGAGVVKWRKKLESIPAASQCMLASGKNSSEKAPVLQNKGKTKCYICGRLLRGPAPSEYHTMECEHILSILPALTNYWLIKKGAKYYTPKEMEFLSKEYDWSHLCCNRWKSDFNIVQWKKNGGKNGKWGLNNKETEKMVQTIKNACIDDPDGKKYCGEITPPSCSLLNPKKRLKTLDKRTRPLVTNIQSAMNFINDKKLYDLYQKYKLLAAIDDETFWGAVMLGLKSNSEKNKKTYGLMVKKGLIRQQGGRAYGVKKVKNSRFKKKGLMFEGIRPQGTTKRFSKPSSLWSKREKTAIMMNALKNKERDKRLDDNKDVVMDTIDNSNTIEDYSAAGKIAGSFFLRWSTTKEDVLGTETNLENEVWMQMADTFKCFEDDEIDNPEALLDAEKLIEPSPELTDAIKTKIIDNMLEEIKSEDIVLENKEDTDNDEEMIDIDKSGSGGEKQINYGGRRRRGGRKKSKKRKTRRRKKKTCKRRRRKRKRKRTRKYR